MTKLIKRRSFLKGSTAAMGALVFGTTAPYYFQRNIAKAQESGDIKVGILHSLSGTIAIIETSLHNAELLAIEEINAKGESTARSSYLLSKTRSPSCRFLPKRPKNCCWRIRWQRYSAVTLRRADNRCCGYSRNTTVSCSIPLSTKHKNAAKTASIRVPCPISSSTISFHGSSRPWVERNFT